jgi:hypothetical protein
LVNYSEINKNLIYYIFKEFILLHYIMLHYICKLVSEFDSVNINNKNEDNLSKIFNSVSIKSSSNNDNQKYYGKPFRYKNINSSSFENK